MVQKTHLFRRPADAALEGAWLEGTIYQVRELRRLRPRVESCSRGAFPGSPVSPSSSFQLLPVYISNFLWVGGSLFLCILK